MRHSHPKEADPLRQAGLKSTPVKEKPVTAKDTLSPVNSPRGISSAPKPRKGMPGVLVEGLLQTWYAGSELRELLL